MPELTLPEFEVVAKVLRSEEPGKTAVRMVLVEGRSISEAVAATALLQPSVSRSIKRFRATHNQILEGYDRRK